MRNYWLKILLGAFAIFAVGMIGVSLVRGGVSRVHEIVEGEGPLTIPLGFIPFSVDGERLGTVKRLILDRPEPRKVGSVEVHIDLNDSLVAQGLSGCRLAANLEGGREKGASHKEGMNVHLSSDSATFTCLQGDSVPEDLVEFGQAVLQPGDIEIPLFLKRDLVEELETGFADSAEQSVVNADSIAEAAKAQVDSAMAAAGMQGKAAGEMGRRLGDSLRKVGQARRDSVLKQMADSADAP